jgi:hypothetical protein
VNRFPRPRPWKNRKLALSLRVKRFIKARCITKNLRSSSRIESPSMNFLPGGVLEGAQI